MDIKELEFIRDLSGNLDTFEDDLIELSSGLEDGLNSEDLNYSKWCASLVHQLGLLTEKLTEFKSAIDRKYYSVWKKAYPNMEDEENEDNTFVSLVNSLKDCVAGQKDFASLQKQFERIQKARSNEL